MQAAPNRDLLEAGRSALGTGDWERARGFFEVALAQRDSAEGRLGLGNALWWLGDFGSSLEERERAYIGFRRDGNQAQAAIVALWLSMAYQAGYANRAAAQGWLARAERAIDTLECPPLRGWLLLAKANQVTSPEDGLGLAGEVLAVATRVGDRDLEFCALSTIGAWLVTSGRVDEGMVHLDEAMAGCLAGEPNDLNVVVVCSCHMLLSCAKAGDYRRAVEWCQASDRFIGRYGCPYLFACCRAVYGRVLLSLGEWGRAECELLEALRASDTRYRPIYAEAAGALGELRVRQGRLEEARQVLAGFEDEPSTVVAVASAHLAAGELPAAASVLRRRLRQIGTQGVEAAALVELLVEVHLGQADLLAAAEAADQLAVVAALGGRELDAARAHVSRGRLALATGDADKAQSHLQAALDDFTRMGLPFERSCARLELARAQAADDRDAAIVDACAARETFEQLGASRHADSAAAVIRSLGGRPRTGTRAEGPLTRREAEVFRLLGLGLSNPEIAARLYISRKTVEHHVSKILAKLRLRSRAEAAARAGVTREAGISPK